MTAGLGGRCPAGNCGFTNRKKPVAATRRNGTGGQHLPVNGTLEFAAKQSVGTEE